MDNERKECPMCGISEVRKFTVVEEMMHGTGEKHRYAECAECGSLYICAYPENMSKYYENGYYSFESHWTHLKNAIGNDGMHAVFKIMDACNAMAEKCAIWNIFRNFRPPAKCLDWMKEAGAGKKSRILDVGCGDGRLLFVLRCHGYEDLTGIDPFLGACQNTGGVSIHNCGIEEIRGEYDLIMMHHSLEHMQDPLFVLNTVHKLLKNQGQVLIRIPIAQSFSHLKYGKFWVEWDAPRHLSIPSESGMNILAERSGMYVRKTIYDSTEFQFTGSQAYKLGMSLDKARFKRMFTKGELREYATRSMDLNRRGCGGRAAFYLCKQ